MLLQPIRNMISQFLIGIFATGITSVVLGQSFSAPFYKVQTNGKTVLPSTRTHHRGIAQVGEIDQEVVSFLNLIDLQRSNM